MSGNDTPVRCITPELENEVEEENLDEKSPKSNKTSTKVK